MALVYVKEHSDAVSFSLDTSIKVAEVFTGKMARLATTIRLPTCTDIIARADEDLIVPEGFKEA